MGIFDNLFSKAESDEDVALQLFESQGLGGKIGRKAQKILNSCHSKQEILLKSIELCGPNPTTPKQLYIVSHCYVWLGAKYRPQAIEYLNKYIEAGAQWEGTPQGTIKMDGYSVNQLNGNRASVYNYLGKAYEGEYDFDKAEEAYLNAEKLEPYCAGHSVCVSNIYIKKNNLDQAMQYLENKKALSYYKSNADNYKTLIDAAINDVSEKITKGYTYKPRKKKNG